MTHCLRVVQKLIKGSATVADLTSLMGTRPTILSNTRISYARLSIKVCRAGAPYPSLVPQIVLGRALLYTIQLQTFDEWQPSADSVCGMDPTVILLSPVPLHFETKFQILKHGYLHSCSTSLLPQPSDAVNGMCRYTTSIATWSQIIEPEGGGREFMPFSFVAINRV